MSCPDAAVVQAFVELSLDGRERDVIVGHIEGCDPCRRWSAALMATSASSPREAQAMAQVEHLSVSAVYDVGTWQARCSSRCVRIRFISSQKVPYADSLSTPYVP